MKTPLLILTIAGFGLLTLAASLAGEPSGQPINLSPKVDSTTRDRPAVSVPASRVPRTTDQTTKGHPASENDGHAPEMNGPAGAIVKTSPAHGQIQDHPKQSITNHEKPGEERGGNIRAGTASASHIIPPRPALKPTAPVAKSAAVSPWPATRAANPQIPPGKLPVDCGTSVALPGVAHPRSAGTVNLGGPVSSGAKNSLTSLNGSDFRVKRKF